MNETKYVKYQIKIKTEPKKCKQNKIGFSSVYLHSTTKTVINFSLDKFFKEILFRIEKWINEGSGWIIELINSQYINVSTLRSLSGSSDIKLPAELNSSKNGLINIKTMTKNIFFWCHIRHSNPLKIYSKRTTKQDKELISALDYEGIESSVSKKIIVKLKWKTKFASKFFARKIGWLILFTYQIKNLKMLWICCLYLMKQNRIIVHQKFW